ncbi:bacterio-opsin activator domain-containing protein [Halobellus limi]|uniref:HalX domain-containing protein n=1 Tax=Halobellus limi TaxID=699433 RepID=A0A1H5ZQL2_9EURY|nr:bacterio-opsin activator domain-containing protein [Halobellus limi]QCC47979.1 response regulator [Halobellus limi]SEG38788.1 HalX domain-containing protein [Halobellus limi]
MLSEGVPGDAAAASDPESAEADPVVLVVDDDRDLADTCRYWLRDDYEVRVAYGGESALDQMDDAVDVVLLDRRMPDLSGDEVLDEIDARGYDCRVAMMTAVEPDTDIVDMPFDEYLVKPVDEDDLRETVEELLVRSEFDDRIREYFALVSTETVLDERDVGELGNPDVLDDLTERVRALRDERESEIRERERQLDRIRRINDFIREIDRALVDATTREDIADSVCATFEASPYEGAWVARYNRATDTVECQSASDSVAAPFGIEASGSSPVEGIETDSTVGDGVAPETVEDAPVAPADVVREAVETGAVVTATVSPSHASAVLTEADPSDAERSIVAVPIGYRETVYGALVVYVRGTVTDEERSMLRDVGETVGHGINAAESKQLLYSDTAVELEFEHGDTRDLIVDLSLEFETTVRLEGTALADGGVVSCYVAVEGVDPSAVLSAIAPLEALVDARIVTEENEEAVLELRLTAASAVVTLVELGATVESFVATRGEGRLVVRVPTGSDLRALTDAVQSSFPDASVVAKREVEDAVQSTSSFRRQLDEKLTDRQRDVMETALASGYFEWPRGSTAEEVASSLGIAAPTFHEHLRSGERKLIEAFFSESSDERRAGERDRDAAADER